MRTRIKYSQNFLKDPNLVNELVKKSDISHHDLVYEIGAGNGIVTQALLNQAKQVVAFEQDKNLCNKLAQRFRDNKSLELRLEDFLKCFLPNCPYKVFSNIPFNVTSQIIKKLTFADHPPEATFLITQLEAAQKFAGKPLAQKNSQVAVILNPWFEFSVIHRFKANDFYPKPKVKVVLIEIKHRKSSSISHQDQAQFRDFVTYIFGHNKPQLFKHLCHLIKISPQLQPSRLNFNDWLKLFNTFQTLPTKSQNTIHGSFVYQLTQEIKIKKIHRTRIDKNWRNKQNPQHQLSNPSQTT